MSLAPLPPGEGHLWCAYPERMDDRGLLRDYEALLSEAEWKRYSRLRFARHRTEFLVTRALVRFALSQYCAIRPRDWKFASNSYGRPEIDPPTDLRFNLSNAPGMVVCLVSRGSEVGVDVEPFARAPSILELAPEVFSSKELAALHGMTRTRGADHALSLWTLKESYIKARGMGLALALEQFSFALAPGGTVRIELDPRLMDRASRWAFALLDRSGHRVAATMERSESVEPRLRIWETTPLADFGEVP